MVKGKQTEDWGKDWLGGEETPGQILVDRTKTESKRSRVLQAVAHLIQVWPDDASRSWTDLLTATPTLTESWDDRDTHTGLVSYRCFSCSQGHGGKGVAANRSCTGGGVTLWKSRQLLSQGHIDRQTTSRTGTLSYAVCQIPVDILGVLGGGVRGWGLSWYQPKFPEHTIDNISICGWDFVAIWHQSY